jgi:peptidoglycan/xylan/chitin deacetylase (PgdA/CDA1 family)
MPEGRTARLAAIALVLMTMTTPRDGEAQTGRPRPRVTRAVAFTFDDLPVARSPALADARAITDRLLGQIRTLGIPAIGFVNEGKLHQVPGEESQRTALLAAWLDQGLDLGNHTYSHMRLYGASLADFQADVLRGEEVTLRLMEERHRRPRYFRHPTLNTGPNPETKEAVERFLAEHGYIIAPVTIDNDEYLYAFAYDGARVLPDSALMQRIGRDYVRYMEEVFAFYEQLSISLLQRELKQVLLLHANALNAEYLDELAAMLVGRGYVFVSLDNALTDPAYALPDSFIGARGPSWLERWAVTRGQNPGQPPPVPEWVRATGR